MSDEKLHIKPGMKLRLLNESGRGRETRFFDADTGVEFMPSGVTYPIKVNIPDSATVNIKLTMHRVPVDLVGTVIGMKMTDDSYYIEVDPAQYDIRVLDAHNGMKRVYFERKK